MTTATSIKEMLLVFGETFRAIYDNEDTKTEQKRLAQYDFCSGINGLFMYSLIKSLLNTLEDG